MAKRKASVVLPEAGQVFAFPLADGRFGTCRVLRSMTEKEAKEYGAKCVLVACSTWIGDSIPSTPTEQMRETLHLTHHSWKGKPELFWVSSAVPAKYVLIGTLEPTDKESRLKCDTSGGWEGCAIQVLAQWRWDNEREEVLKRDAEVQAALAAKQAANEEALEKSRKAITLRELTKYKFFESWDDYPPAKTIRASRKIMKETVQALIELGEKAAESDRLQLLQTCIEQFNELNTAQGDFIETSVREDICDEFELIVYACGLGHVKDMADQWRDW